MRGTGESDWMDTHLETNLLSGIGSWIDAPKVPGFLVGKEVVG